MNGAIESLPVLVLYPHSRCNCRCLMCDIWKGTEGREIGAADFERYMADFERLAVRWVVFSGGEPLMHSELFRLCGSVRERGIRMTILSSGLLLERHREGIAASVDDLIVSLDGPAAVHDRIRRVAGAFASIERGIAGIRRLRRQFPVAARCTVQRANMLRLRDTAAEARSAGFDSISFLAADLASDAFNRPQGWSTARQAEIAPDAAELPLLEREIEGLIDEWGASGFVRESASKLRRIVQHYRAHLGLCASEAPRCNAPWVSAVVETDGTLRPCFFQPPIGRIGEGGLAEALNSPEARAFRTSLNVSADPVCRRCVCSLYVPAG